MKKILMKSRVWWLAFVTLFCGSSYSRAQIAPGPYEILPFEDGFIIEAFFDLAETTGPRADWSGWSGTNWVSPNAYDNHKGTDIAVQTGTPLYANVAGIVTEVVTNFLKNDHSTPYGNYVRIAVDQPAPTGEALDMLYLHMWVVTATNGQRVAVGDQVGLSDNTGNSTSEHVHIQSEKRGGAPVCPFYWGHYKYPILFNPAGTHQIGHVLKVMAATSVIRTDRFDSSPQITTAHQNQLFFASYAKRGYYQVFLPNNATYRSGWIRATDVQEVFDGNVIQPLPDNVTYAHVTQLQSKYPIRAAADDGAAQIGQILFGGGRFVTDQVTNGFYRIPLPGASAQWGWVKADNRMIVYPQLVNPSVDLNARPNNDFPIQEQFSIAGKSMFGRPKFTRSVVKAFQPASPDGDGQALFITDANNSGNGLTESVLVGKPGHRNYYVECDVYINYRPAHITSGRWDRYGIFLRDDGFAGMSDTFEGGGNGYAILYDSDDGRLRAGRLDNATATDLQAAARYVTNSAWRTLRIEARENQIRYFMDGTLLAEVNDSTFPSGGAGMGYRWHAGSPGQYPVARGAYFDNFTADTLDPVPVRFGKTRLDNGSLKFTLSGTVGSTSIVERSSSLEPLSWLPLSNVVHDLSVIELHDPEEHLPCRFYRARVAP